MKTTLKVGIAPREIIARYTRDVVAGRRRRTADDPDIWFASVESFAKVLSDRYRALLALIAKQKPDSPGRTCGGERPREEQSLAHPPHNGALPVGAPRKGRGPQSQTRRDIREKSNCGSRWQHRESTSCEVEL
jgi:hypothetical protein